MSKNSMACLALLALLPTAGLVAAEGGADAPTITGETGYFSLFSAATVPRGEWSFGLYYNNWDRLVIEDGVVPLIDGFSSQWDYDWHRLSASLAYGVTDTFEVSLMLPYEVFDASDSQRFGRINGRFFVNEIDASGLGNLRLGGKWRVTDTGDGGLALNAFIEVDTGDEEEGVVTGDTGFGLGLAYQRRGWVFNLGYRDPGDADRLAVPEEISAGLGYAASINERLDWITEVGATFFDGEPGPSDDAYDVTTGGRLWLGEGSPWAFNFAFRTNVAHLDDTDEFCPIGGLLGLTYFPRPQPPPPPPPPPPADYALTVRKTGDGSGTVTSAPAGIDCGSDCAESYPEGTAVTLTAAAAADSTFGGWGGDPDCSDGAVTMSADRACTARFDKKPVPPPPPPPPPPEIEEVCHFASGSARVDNRCKATLDEVALRMKDEPDRWALVIGYSDSTGGDAINQRTSERRAEAVKGYLVTRHGIDPSRITTEGRGAADPVGNNATAEGRAQNRRAVIKLKVRGG